ncbi:very short patch repair endonuclease [Micromonospora sp. MH99]|uniref:very short patch repair endonuclease n=1 Tax=Micromonospora sp. MH99 TaxID=1945510 RepID=UPI0027DFCF6C|nr:very short patch repair endonuclease [Micromonospora sp. MH99]MCF0093111.1 Very short patch repair protein [Micromonospora sp. MH99]
MNLNAARVEGGWADKPPEPRAWKGRQGRTRRAASLEQDRAAGGPERRWVDLGDGRQARASVELKLLPKTRRIRAYLRWSDNGRSPTRYLGEVEYTTRAENLTEGWRLAWSRGFLALPDTGESAKSWAKNSNVRAVMRANKARDTRPERRLRSLLHKRGLRYRVNCRPLADVRRTADIIFSAARVAVFVDGCYWHGCPEHYRPARVNDRFWHEKIDRNRARDRETEQMLADAGWSVIRVWEHEDPVAAADRVEDLVKGSRLRPVE